jgi:molybdopterin synthase catalytic subunit
MDLNTTLAELKNSPGFADQVGMILIHNGVVRGRTKDGQQPVNTLTVKPDTARIEAIQSRYEQKPGIFRVLIQAREGTFVPGDDLLHIIVAGDIREHVKPVLAEVLEEVKTQAMHKEER